MKIKNVKKRIGSIFLLFFILLSFSLLISNMTFSYGEKKYTSYYVAKGDTIWEIAKEQRERNTYYQNSEIREIIFDIKQVNQLNNVTLRENQELKIPTI